MKRCPYCKEDVLPKAVLCPSCEKPLSKGRAAAKQFNGYNVYGITRHIPPDIEEAVRRECGYGCVACGKMIVQFDHFEPEFKDLKHPHKSGGIALICPDCHTRKKGKLVPKIQATS